MEEDPEGTETTQREGLERREEVSGQESCRAESSEKSTGREAGRGWTAEIGNSGADGEGWERSSATPFWEPGRWTRLLVNSKMKDSCLCWRADQGGETLNRACVRGLWSAKKVKFLPSRRKQKCLMVE